jgi:hypothetical protein
MKVSNQDTAYEAVAGLATPEGDILMRMGKIPMKRQ